MSEGNLDQQYRPDAAGLPGRDAGPLGVRLVVGLLTVLWFYVQTVKWSHAFGSKGSDSLRELASDTESRWAWRLLSLADSLPSNSLTRALLRGWAALVTPAQMSSIHKVAVDRWMLHFALTMATVIAISIVVGIGVVVLMVRRPAIALSRPEMTPARAWAGFVSWQFANLWVLVLAHRYTANVSDEWRAIVNISFYMVAGLAFGALVSGRARLLRVTPGNLLLGIGGFGLAFPLTAAAQWLQSLCGLSASGNSMIGLVARGGTLELQFLLTLTVVLTPLAEELWYRGCFVEALRNRLGARSALVLGALFFAADHADPGAFLPLFALGIVFGSLYLRTGSLVPGMIAHGMWNATSFFLVRLAVV